MERTKALTALENHYCAITSPEDIANYKAEIRRIYMSTWAETLIKHLEKTAKERADACVSK